jgi:hypothetical protein
MLQRSRSWIDAAAATSRTACSGSSTWGSAPKAAPAAAAKSTPSTEMWFGRIPERASQAATARADPRERVLSGRRSTEPVSAGPRGWFTQRAGRSHSSALG